MSRKIDRLNEEILNNQSCLMKIVEYNKAIDIIVEFQDEYKARVHTNYDSFIKGRVKNPMHRFGEESMNNQGCLMKIIQYNQYRDIIVEFQDEHRAKVHTTYQNFLLGQVKNPYYKSVFNIGIVGDKYPIKINGNLIKEYSTWRDVLNRSFNKKYKEKCRAYKDVTCCDEWLLFENFYEWLHSQENFDKWLNGKLWAIDKDILIKGNKVYSPDTCCLVPKNINTLFVKNDENRGNLPIGVTKKRDKFEARCDNPLLNIREHLGLCLTPEEAFYAYKKRKEEIIKQVAQEEYSKGNITKQCYDAMMNYEVEITD